MYCQSKHTGKKRRKILIPDESLLSYLVSTPDYYGKTNSPLKFYILDENGKPTRRSNETGASSLVFDQERALAFDYQSICGNYDINLVTVSELEKENNE